MSVLAIENLNVRPKSNISVIVLICCCIVLLPIYKGGYRPVPTTLFFITCAVIFVLSQQFVDFGSNLKYPLLVKDRDEFMRLAENSKIALGDWFTSPLHPVKANLDDWHFNEADFPNAVFAAQHVVNLPTTNIESKRVINFLSQNINLIMSA